MSPHRRETPEELAARIKARGKTWSVTGRPKDFEQRAARRSHCCNDCGETRAVIGYWAGDARKCAACGKACEVGVVVGGWGDPVVAERTGGR